MISFCLAKNKKLSYTWSRSLQKISLQKPRAHRPHDKEDHRLAQRGF